MSLIAVLAVIGAASLPVLGFEFVSWDDPVHLLQNPLVVNASASSWLDHLRTPQLDYPAPLTVLTYRLEYALFGLKSPLPYHLTNLLLHLTVCVLVFAVGRRLGLSSLGASAATVIVGLHPVVAEPVSWVTGRKDLLQAALVLGATYQALRPKPSWRSDAWVWLLVALAIAAKPVAVFAGLALPVLVYLRGQDVRTIAKRFAPIWLFIVVMLPLAYLSQSSTARAGGAPDVSYLRAVWYALGYHLGLLFLLHPTSAKYLPRPWPPGFSPLVDLAPLAVFLLGVVIYRWLGSDEKRIARCAAAWGLLAYLPYSNLLPLLRFLADAYLYLPLVGLAWFVGAAVENLHRNRQGKLAPVAVASAALLLAMMLLPSQARWRDSVNLWAATFETFPHDYRLCRNLGNAIYARDGAEAAVEQYQDCSQRFDPRPFEKNLAIALVRLERFDEAEPLLEGVARRQPDDFTVRRLLEEIRRRRQTSD